MPKPEQPTFEPANEKTKVSFSISQLWFIGLAVCGFLWRVASAFTGQMDAFEHLQQSVMTHADYDSAVSVANERQRSGSRELPTWADVKRAMHQSSGDE